MSVFWRIKRWVLICFPILVALEWVGQGLSIIDVIFCYTLNRKCLLQDHIQANKLNFSEKKWKQMACSLIFITFERAILFREKILGLFKEVQWNFQCLLRLGWSQLWSTEPLYCTFAAMRRWTPQNAYVFFFNPIWHRVHLVFGFIQFTAISLSMDISIKWTPATIPCPVLFFTQFKSSTEVLPNKFHFNDHSTGFRPQTQKVTLFYHAPSTFAGKEFLVS